LRPFTGHPEVRQVIVALPPGYAERPPEWLAKLRGERLGLVPGGAQRADSVRAGLEALPADSAIILVHDAARPFVSRGTIDAVIARARAGVAPWRPCRRRTRSKRSRKARPGPRRASRAPVDRERIWRAQDTARIPPADVRDAYAQLPTAANGGAPSDDAECASAPDSRWS